MFRGRRQNLEDVIQARDSNCLQPSVESEALLHDLNLDIKNIFKHLITINSGKSRAGTLYSNLNIFLSEYETI